VATRNDRCQACSPQRSHCVDGLYEYVSTSMFK
jgi:hypothetical protein